MSDHTQGKNNEVRGGEQWRLIPGYGSHEVSNLGRVRRRMGASNPVPYRYISTTLGRVRLHAEPGGEHPPVLRVADLVRDAFGEPAPDEGGATHPDLGPESEGLAPVTLDERGRPLNLWSEAAEEGKR